MNVRQSWLVWAIATSFFSFQFVLRLFPGLLVPELMSQFSVGATDLGILSAAYYAGYSGMQIPLGIALDRYPTRNILLTCTGICILGVLLFSFSAYWPLVTVGRFMMGMGSAGGFLSTVKVIRNNFHVSKFTFMVGLSFSIGLMGALYGGQPTSMLLEHLGWQQLSLCLMGALLFIFCCIFFFFPKAPADDSVDEPHGNEGHNVSLSDSFKELLNYPKVFWVGLAGALMVGPFEGFADIWGVSYFVNIHGFEKSHASFVVSFIYFGMLFGGPILSFIAEKLNAFYQTIAACALFMAVAFVLLLFWNGSLSDTSLVTMMGFVGILCCYQVILFGLVAKLVPPHLSGLTTSVTNCINMVAGSFFHLGMGFIMDFYWSGNMQDGVRVYDKHSYINSVALIPVMSILGFVFVMFLRDRKSSTSANAAQKPEDGDMFLSRQKGT